ncbi:uncharacterized protein [Clytia hemisphaerica]|uniref:uncharacterized protein n=1 Tax=Clytia hemisphaerica TaxID=252671 RepID=UPI0034D76211
MELTRTERGREKILENGYIYVFQKDLANDLKSFECELRRRGQCKAKVKVDILGDIVERLNEHTHQPSATKVEVTKIKVSLKEQAATSHDSTQNIVGNEIAAASASAIVNLPPVNHLKRTMRNQRGNDLPPNPINRAGIPNLPQEFQRTMNDERFLLFHSGVGDDRRIILFCTDRALELLQRSRHWYADGTFRVCPEIFFQVYTIDVRVNERTIPCVFSLLPNKTEDTYGRMIDVLLNFLPNGTAPDTILFDFERAAINVALRSFPNVVVNGCFFHLTSNVWKKIQSLGMQQRYIDHPDFALHVRMIPALAFIPEDDVIDVFEELVDQLRELYGADLDALIDYFEDTYIGRFQRNRPRRRPLFAIELWNM